MTLHNTSQRKTSRYLKMYWTKWNENTTYQNCGSSECSTLREMYSIECIY
jgi:hypothetical protein